MNKTFVRLSMELCKPIKFFLTAILSNCSDSPPVKMAYTRKT